MTFNSYLANNSVGIKTSVLGCFGRRCSGCWLHCRLAWSMSPISDTAGNGSLTAGWAFSSTSLQSVATAFGTTPATLGYFQGQNFGLNPYTASTTVYFEVIAYQTASGSYAASTIRGHSASFSSALAVTGLALATDIGTAGLQAFTVATVPGTHHAGFGWFGWFGRARGVPPQAGLIGLFIVLVFHRKPLFGAASFFIDKVMID